MNDPQSLRQKKHQYGYLLSFRKEESSIVLIYIVSVPSPSTDFIHVLGIFVHNFFFWEFLRAKHSL